MHHAHALAHAGESQARVVARPRGVEAAAVVAHRELQALAVRATAARSPRSRERGARRCSALPARRGTGTATLRAGSASGTSRASTSTRSAPWRATRSHSALSASTSPRSSSTEGCRRYDSACTSSREPHQVLAQWAHAFGRRGRMLHAAGVDGEARQPLREVVVQLAREVPALVLVRGDQAPAQIDGFVFRPAARLAAEQRGDEGGLEQHDRRPRHDQQPVLLPQRRRPEAHFGAGRQPRLGDAPAARARASRTPAPASSITMPRSAAASAFQHAPRDCPAVIARPAQFRTSGPPTMPSPSWLSNMPNTGAFADAAHRGQRPLVLVGHAVRVHQKNLIEHRGVGRQRGHALAQLLRASGRAARQLDAARQRGKLAPASPSPRTARAARCPGRPRACRSSGSSSRMLAAIAEKSICR